MTSKLINGQHLHGLFISLFFPLFLPPFLQSVDYTFCFGLAETTKSMLFLFVAFLSALMSIDTVMSWYP